MPVEPALKTMSRVAKAYISINGQAIRKNAVVGTKEHPIRIATSKSGPAVVYASRIKINGPSELMYDPGKRIMKCGARLVLVCNYTDLEIVRCR